MRALQKLIRNGSSTVVTIPRSILIALGWLPGQPIIVEVLEDRSLRIRLPTEADVAPKAAPRIVLDGQMPAFK